jgi:hypothetical protein
MLDGKRIFNRTNYHAYRDGDLKQVHGYGKQPVDNVAVVTRLDELEQRITRGQEQIAQLTEGTKLERKQVKEVARTKKKTDLASSKLKRQQDQLERQQAEQATIESRRRIFKRDVELDPIFSVLKVALVLAITFVLKEYLGSARMEPLTFLERVATLPARLRLLPSTRPPTGRRTESMERFHPR